MYGLFGLLLTSGENFISTLPSEIYLLRKMLTCLILMLPAVFGKPVSLLLTEHTQEFQARQPDRKRENEQKSVASSDSQSEASSSRGNCA